MDDFHLRQTPYSDPGELDVSDLPRDPRELMCLVRDLMVHQLKGGRVGYGIPEERLHHDAESRYVTAILRILPREILSLAPFHGLRTVTLASSPPV
ncbi:hypothetical protein ACWD3J_13565 [Streptomyces sp. NPDC002755]|uniref:hypothetical protein n=1 Tax=Streptomyces sp. NPDC002884 TaxID=3154544 RepID=UPI003328F494